MRVGGPAAEKGRDRKKGTRSLALSSLRSAFFFGVLDAAWCSLFRWQRAGARSDFCAIPTCVGLSLSFGFSASSVFSCASVGSCTLGTGQKRAPAPFSCAGPHITSPRFRRVDKKACARTESTRPRASSFVIFFFGIPSTGTKNTDRGRRCRPMAHRQTRDNPQDRNENHEKENKKPRNSGGSPARHFTRPLSVLSLFFFPTACRRKSRTGSRRGLGVLGH